MIDISQFGKGAIPTPESIKKDHFKLSAAPALPKINWNKERRPRYLPIANQQQASDCTAEATVKYGQNILFNIFKKVEDWSRRFIYSQTWIPPEGGAYIWKAMGIPLADGFVSEASVPAGDYFEATMRDASLNHQGVKEAVVAKYAQLNNTHDMDYCAWVIDTFGGFVTGFNGWNGMFSPNGTVVDWSHSDWGHAVFVYDYGINEKGEKVLIFINSWSDKWGDQGYGYFPEAFVKSGMMFDLYTYASIEDIDPASMNNRFVGVEGQKDVWFVRDGQRSLITNGPAFVVLCGDWSKIEKITQAQLDAIPATGQQIMAGVND